MLKLTLGAGGVAMDALCFQRDNSTHGVFLNRLKNGLLSENGLV